MARKSKKPASRGSVNNTILEVLSEGEKYGYEIIKEVEEKSNGKIVLKQPSLYSSLSRFEEKGYVSSCWRESNIGGKRHYYKLTDLGAQVYYNLKHKDENIEINKSDNQILESENLNEFESTENISSLTSESIFELDSTSLDNNNTCGESTDDDIFDNSTSFKLKNYKDFDVSEKLKSLLEDNQPTDEENFDNQLENNEIEILNKTNNESIKTLESDLVFSNSIENLEKDLEDIKNNSIADNNLKSVYADIKTLDSTKHEEKNNYNENNFVITDPTPLTYLEQQKRKASMEILYGNNQFYYYPSNSQKSIAQNEEQIDLENYIALKETLNNKKFLYNKNDYFKKKEKPYIFKYLYSYPTNSKNPSSITKNTALEQKKIKYKFDEFGIMKIDNSETEKSNNKQNNIIDNVGYRSYNHWFDNNYKKQKTTQLNNDIELTQEEIEVKNKNFNELFNKIAKEKYETTPNSNENCKEQQPKELIETYDNKEEHLSFPIFEAIEDKFIDFGDTKEISNKLENFNLTQENNQQEKSNLTNFKIKTYGEANSYITETTNKFVSINKINLIFAIFFSLFTILQTAALVLILKNFNLLQEKDIL